MCDARWHRMDMFEREKAFEAKYGKLALKQALRGTRGQ